MGNEKQGSKGANYVGGFLQMFDWNAKSRKKLFSSKSEVSEQYKQKKRCDGNFPITRLHSMDADENAAVSSVKGSSDHSCNSSIVDEEFCGTKAPGVVARLMGLDSLPKSSMPDPYSTPLFDSLSLQDYRNKSLGYYQDHSMHFSGLQDLHVRNDVEPKYPKVIHRPIEKFQTEILPPKSAKSIPFMHHKLLSPIKSANFIPPKDAAQIMEAAARIIDRPQERTKMKQPLVGSSSVPLRVRDLKEKVQAARKPSKVFEGSQRKAESSAVKNLRGHSMNKSWNGSADATPLRVLPDPEESSNSVKHKSKSVSLALQAKANVQKRESLNVNSSRNLVSQKEPSELSPNHLFKSQSTMHKSMLKKPSIQNGSSVLRPNNQKQNCNVDKAKLPSKCTSKGGKTLSGESSSARQRSSGKLAGGTLKVNPRKVSSDVKENKREVLPSSTERVASKKRSADGNYHPGKNQAAQNMEIEKNGKAVQSRDIVERQNSWDQDSGMSGTDVVSFTFTSPMTRSGSDSGRATEAVETCKIFSAGSQSKRSLLSSDGTSASRFSYHGHNVKGGDALSVLLEQKLIELARKVDFSQQKSGTDVHDMVPGLEVTMSSTLTEENEANDGTHTDNQEASEETSMSECNTSQSRKLLDCRLPSPVSVLEHSSPFAESSNSSDTADCSSAGGKQCSSIQALDSYSSHTFLGIEGYAELSDSGSSTSTKRLEATLTFTHSGNPKRWQLEFVKKILSNIETMFYDYALGIARAQSGILKPHLFDQLESCNSEVVPISDQRILFDCVGESLDMRCSQYASGGYTLWAKGLSVVKRKNRLAEEVHKEVSDWSSNIGESMIDELVEKDMSRQNGKWLNFDIEAFELGIQIESRILNSLIDEVIADLLVL